MTVIAKLFQIQRKWLGCEGCGLSVNRTKMVFGRRVGQLGPGGLIIIGEAPGAEEDLKGRAFVGRSGKKLDQLLEKAGIENVYITNTVCCRPPNNRDPTRKEVGACNPRLKSVIESLKPSAIVTTGKVSSNLVLQTDRPMRSLIGDIFEVDGVPVVPVYHPAYLLRNHKAYLDQQFVRRLQLAMEA